MTLGPRKLAPAAVVLPHKTSPAAVVLLTAPAVVTESINTIPAARTRGPKKIAVAAAVLPKESIPVAPTEVVLPLATFPAAVDLSPVDVPVVVTETIKTIPAARTRGPKKVAQAAVVLPLATSPAASECNDKGDDSPDDVRSKVRSYTELSRTKKIPSVIQIRQANIALVKEFPDGHNFASIQDSSPKYFGCFGLTLRCSDCVGKAKSTVSFCLQCSYQNCFGWGLIGVCVNCQKKHVLP